VRREKKEYRRQETEDRREKREFWNLGIGEYRIRELRIQFLNP
jgi:hypothetical protein